MFAALKQKGQSRRDAYVLYASLVRVARNPALYTAHGIPDTLDGRFDSILLHLFLLEQRLRHEVPPAVLRQVNEAFIDDMDRSLRELGIGDMGVSKRVKSMASAWLGRMKSYEACTDQASWAAALSRNVYRSETPVLQADALALRVLELRDALDRISTPQLLAGNFSGI